MKINFEKLAKPTAITAAIATPTGLLIDHWINDERHKKPDLLSKLQAQNSELEKKLEELDKSRAEDINNLADEIVDKSEEIGNLKNALNDALRQVDEAKKNLDIEKAINQSIDKDRNQQEERIKELEEDLKAKTDWTTIYQRVSRQHISEIGRLAKENKDLKEKIKGLNRSWECKNPRFDKHSSKEIYGKYCEHEDGTETLRYDLKEGSPWNIRIKNEWFQK